MYLVARKKPGPKPENPKDTMLRIRVDKITLDQLDESAEELKTSRSEVVRKGIRMVHDGLKK